MAFGAERVPYRRYVNLVSGSKRISTISVRVALIGTGIHEIQDRCSSLETGESAWKSVRKW